MEADVFPTTEAYLNGRFQNGHALSQMLRTPEPDKGLVYTPREIAQQPLLWRKTANQMAEHSEAIRSFLHDGGVYDEHDPATILLTGAGTSDYIGRSVSDLLRTRLGVPVESYSTTRITACPATYFLPKRRYVVVHFARSGNSPESKAVLMLALQHHADTTRHVVITCNKDGALAALARENSDRVFLVVLDDKCNDRGLAMTGSFSSMVLAAQALAFLGEEQAFSRHANHVASAAEYLIDTYTDTLYDLATPAVERAMFLGNADLLGAATESALKVQELTAGAIMADSHDALAFRHGPISAVNRATLICFFLSAASHTRRYELDVLRQYMEAFDELGAQVVVVTPRKLQDIEWPLSRTITYDPNGKFKIPPYFQVGIAAVVGQLVGLFSSYRRDINVDEPSADKTLYNRTVQGVRIYPYDGVAS